MELISWIIFLVLGLIALVHFGWAFGMAWPAKQRELLVETVVGLPRGAPMPSAALTVIVAIAIMVLGVIALWGAGVISVPVNTNGKSWVLLGAAAIFGLRGTASYLPFGPLQASVDPFRTLDLRYFAPLCLLLASGYIAIFLSL